MKITHLALLGAATVAAAQHHNHAHRHPARRGSPVQARNADVTEIVPAATATVYEMNGVELSSEEVDAGLADGSYVLVGDESSAAPATSAPAAVSTTSTPVAAPTSSSVEAAAFIQEPVSTSSTSTSSTPAPTSSSTSATSSASSSSATYSSSSSASASASSSSSSSSSSGNDADFPSGTIPCSSFPSEYGAVAVDYLGLEGWTGVQMTPHYNGLFSEISDAISFIETAVSGSGGCQTNSFCSYACAPGYQKVQWPASQGATGQSIGGIWCNSNGMLELTRSGVSTLCGQGAGGVEVQNILSQNVPVCRTDYPGTESETIPLNAQPGQTYPLTNPDSNDYYTWEGAPTTAQYYLNPAGTDVSDGCTWGSAGTNVGNWAPVNAGVGKGAGGVTYISLFPNKPTNPDGTLNYNIKITGDVSGDCEYQNGQFYSSGAASENGCTVAVPNGGTATFVFSD